MEPVVKVKKNGKTICEIPLSMYPLDVEMPAVKVSGEWWVRSFTWMLSFYRDEATKQKIKEKPRGMQLS